jgi:acetyl-CoA carboxylase biotin carboxyl carrier protein
VELKQIKELMTAMGRTGTKRLVLKKGGFELQLEREGDGTYRGSEQSLEGDEAPYRNELSMRRLAASLPRGGDMGAALAPHPHPEPDKGASQDGVFITSPMVGTFYATPSPEDPSFVKVGDTVDKNTVVCIVEAMKVMNEIKAGVAGKVAEVYIETNHPVEFGTKLFRIIPS